MQPDVARSAANQPVLEIKDLTKLFGGLRAVSNFDLTVQQGALAGLIGPNGAGKTTVFNMITGLYVPTERRDRPQRRAHRRPGAVRDHPDLGIGRTFQNIRLFPNLTVLDNVRIAYHPHAGYGLVDGLLRNAPLRRPRRRELTEQRAGLPGDLRPGTTSERDRQEPALRRAAPGGDRPRAGVATRKLLLLDEPAAGMNPNEIGRLMEFIHFIRDRFNLTILLIEHQMRLVMNICEKLTVMDFGEVIARGTPREIQDNPQVIEAYLGRGAVAKAGVVRKEA